MANYLVHVIWRDHVGVPQRRTDDELPASLLVEGVVWVVDENANDLIVAAYKCSDGGWTDVLAIAKAALEYRCPVGVEPKATAPVDGSFGKTGETLA